MTVVLVWVGIGLGVALLLLAAWAADRRSRRRGHRRRAAGDVLRDVREERADLQAGDEQRWLNKDRSWTRRSRQAKDPHAP
jgi:hypothetical protein